MGIAAYKTVELDDSLGGAPTQYRELTLFLKEKEKKITYVCVTCVMCVTMCVFDVCVMLLCL